MSSPCLCSALKQTLTKAWRHVCGWCRVYTVLSERALCGIRNSPSAIVFFCSCPQGICCYTLLLRTQDQLRQPHSWWSLTQGHLSALDLRPRSWKEAWVPFWCSTTLLIKHLLYHRRFYNNIFFHWKIYSIKDWLCFLMKMFAGL